MYKAHADLGHVQEQVRHRLERGAPKNGKAGRGQDGPHEGRGRDMKPAGGPDPNAAEGHKDEPGQTVRGGRGSCRGGPSREEGRDDGNRENDHKEARRLFDDDDVRIGPGIFLGQEHHETQSSRQLPQDAAQQVRPGMAGRNGGDENRQGNGQDRCPEHSRRLARQIL